MQVEPIELEQSPINLIMGDFATDSMIDATDSMIESTPMQQYLQLLKETNSILHLQDTAWEGLVYAVRHCFWRDQDGHNLMYQPGCDFPTSCILDDYETSTGAPPSFRHVRVLRKQTGDGNWHVIPVCDCRGSALSQMLDIETEHFPTRTGDFS